MDFIGEVEVSAERAADAEASGYIVVYLDPELTPQCNQAVGPWSKDQLAEALAWADRSEQNVNQGQGPNDAPIKCVVVRLFAPQ